MLIARRPLRRAALIFAFGLSLLTPALGAEKSRVKATDYVIDAEISPKTHRLVARAKVTFTAIEDTNFATFELHNALRVSKVLDGNGKALSSERISQDNSVRVSFPGMVNKGATGTLTFDYEGPLASADDSPVEGLKLAYIGEDSSYLLYAGRWFPMVGFNTNRFSATINVTVPSGITVIGSGAKPGGASRPAGPGKVTYSFAWDRPSFPGTIIAGNFAVAENIPGA